MAHQGHHADQVEDPDEDVGHVGELWPVGAGGRSKKEREKEKMRYRKGVKMSHLKFIDGDPRVCRKSLQHRHQELETSRPVSDEKHDADQVEDPHENAE